MSSPTGVLLMTYGTPQNLDDMEAYLLDIRHGRPATPEFVEEIKRRYQLVGGSPLLHITQRQAELLEHKLNHGSSSFKIYTGMRHWHPYIKDVVNQIVDSGIKKLVSFPLTPYYSKMSTEAYHAAVTETNKILGNPLELVLIKSWNDHPKLIQCFAELTKQGLSKFGNTKLEEITLLFTAHSLPTRILKDNDPYPEKLKETAQLIAQQVGISSYHFAFQSQGGSAEPWLGPTVEETLESFRAQGKTRVLLAPIGFLCDHVEVLYDVDVLFQQVSREKGIAMKRTDSPNDRPLFIETLASVVLENLSLVSSN